MAFILKTQHYSNIDDLWDLLDVATAMVADPNHFQAVSAKIETLGNNQYQVGDIVIAAPNVQIEILSLALDDQNSCRIVNASDTYNVNPGGDNIPVTGGSGTGMTVKVYSAYAPGDQFIVGDLEHVPETDPLAQRSLVIALINAANRPVYRHAVLMDWNGAKFYISVESLSDTPFIAGDEGMIPDGDYLAALNGGTSSPSPLGNIVTHIKIQTAGSPQFVTDYIDGAANPQTSAVATATTMPYTIVNDNVTVRL